jgi:hypothetical protein
VELCHHGLINYIGTQAKKSSSKKLTCKGTLRQTLQSGDTVSYVGIFDLVF